MSGTKLHLRAIYLAPKGWKLPLAGRGTCGSASAEDKMKDPGRDHFKKLYWNCIQQKSHSPFTFTKASQASCHTRTTWSRNSTDDREQNSTLTHLWPFLCRTADVTVSWALSAFSLPLLPFPHSFQNAGAPCSWWHPYLSCLAHQAPTISGSLRVAVLCWLVGQRSLVTQSSFQKSCCYGTSHSQARMLCPSSFAVLLLITHSCMHALFLNVA